MESLFTIIWKKNAFVQVAFDASAAPSQLRDEGEGEEDGVDGEQRAALRPRDQKAEHRHQEREHAQHDHEVRHDHEVAAGREKGEGVVFFQARSKVLCCAVQHRMH